VTELRIVKLARDHRVEQFDCGSEALNRYLARNALGNQLANAAQSYVCLSGEDVAGFMTLATGSIEHGAVPERLRKGLARHPVPVMVLARLAVDRNWQRRGIAASLIKEAMLRTLQVSGIAGVRALVVHAKSDEARMFYRRFGFEEGFPDPMDLYVLTKDLRAIAGL
jgi:GNAT superfamily N-acetyltransferase